MGVCSSKMQVLKNVDDGLIPAPVPEVSKPRSLGMFRKKGKHQKASRKVTTLEEVEKEDPKMGNKLETSKTSDLIKERDAGESEATAADKVESDQFKQGKDATHQTVKSSAPAPTNEDILKPNSDNRVVITESRLSDHVAEINTLDKDDNKDMKLACGLSINKKVYMMILDSVL